MVKQKDWGHDRDLMKIYCDYLVYKDSSHSNCVHSAMYFTIAALLQL